MELLFLGGFLAVLYLIWDSSKTTRIRIDSPRRPPQRAEYHEVQFLHHGLRGRYVRIPLLWKHERVLPWSAEPERDVVDDALVGWPRKGKEEEDIQELLRLARGLDATAISLLDRGFAFEGSALVGTLEGFEVHARPVRDRVELRARLGNIWHAVEGAGESGNPVLDALIRSRHIPDHAVGAVLEFVHGRGGSIRGGEARLRGTPEEALVALGALLQAVREG